MSYFSSVLRRPRELTHTCKVTKARSFESLDSEQKQLIQKNRYLIQFDANTYLTRSLETRWVFGAMSDRVDVAESKKLFNQHNDRPVLDGACEACSQKGIEGQS